MKKGSLIKVALAGVAALAVVYLGGRLYYNTHFLPNTVINHVDCGNLNLLRTEEALASAMENYELHIVDEVADMKVTAQDAGLVYEDSTPVKAALENQNKNGWFLELGKEHSVSAVTGKLNRDGLAAYLDTLECMHPDKVKGTVSAKVKYNEESKQFEIIPEVIGNRLQKDKFFDAVEQAMLNCEEGIDLTTREYYRQPKFYATDEAVLQVQEKANQYLKAVVHIEHGDFEYTVEADDIGQFLRVNKKMKLYFSKDKMIDFVVDNICPVFNTVGTTRTFHSPGSGDITIGGGAYGWRISVKDERKQLKKDIRTCGEVTREPIYMQEAKSREKGNDIGDSYVDVNIGAQHLWVIKEGSIVFSSDFVSGNPNLGRQTDKGVHYVEYKRTDYDMSNYNVWVKYWLPFNTAEGEGFHDATWRNTFGGSYYLRDGSHGCINLPLYAAKTLYDILPCGFPVIVH